MRRYDDPVEVRKAMVGGTEGPEQFLWRGRLWKVCDVRQHVAPLPQPSSPQELLRSLGPAHHRLAHFHGVVITPHFPHLRLEPHRSINCRSTPLDPPDLRNVPESGELLAGVGSRSPPPTASFEHLFEQDKGTP